MVHGQRRPELGSTDPLLQRSKQFSVALRHDHHGLCACLGYGLGSLNHLDAFARWRLLLRHDPKVNTGLIPLLPRNRLSSYSPLPVRLPMECAPNFATGCCKIADSGRVNCPTGCWTIGASRSAQVHRALSVHLPLPWPAKPGLAVTEPHVSACLSGRQARGRLLLQVLDSRSQPTPHRPSSNTDLPLDPSPLVQRHSSCRRMRPSGRSSGVDRHTPVISSPRSFTWW